MICVRVYVIPSCAFCQCIRKRRSSLMRITVHRLNGWIVSFIFFRAPKRRFCVASSGTLGDSRNEKIDVSYCRSWLNCILIPRFLHARKIAPCSLSSFGILQVASVLVSRQIKSVSILKSLGNYFRRWSRLPSHRRNIHRIERWCLPRTNITLVANLPRLCSACCFTAKRSEAKDRFVPPKWDSFEILFRRI
jgi:hypothetical protein